MVTFLVTPSDIRFGDVFNPSIRSFYHLRHNGKEKPSFVLCRLLSVFFNGIIIYGVGSNLDANGELMSMANGKHEVWLSQDDSDSAADINMAKSRLDCLRPSTCFPS
jgi:hypothetical protein